MKKSNFKTATFIFGTIILFGCSNNQNEKEKIAMDVSKSELKRGEYLVNVIGCGDCHSPKVMTNQGPVFDTTALFSGHRSNLPKMELSEDAFKKGWVLFNYENTSLATPGFVSYAANITSDTTGIGLWTFEQFKIAMTQGKWKGMKNSRDLYPPMPWMNYRHLTNEDLKAIFEFLKTTKPVRNIVPNSYSLMDKEF